MNKDLTYLCLPINSVWDLFACVRTVKSLVKLCTWRKSDKQVIWGILYWLPSCVYNFFAYIEANSTTFAIGNQDRKWYLLRKKARFWESATRGTIISLVTRPPTQRYYYYYWHCYYFYCYSKMKKAYFPVKVYIHSKIIHASYHSNREHCTNT